MRVLLQRVQSASVTIHGQEHSRIGAGLLVLVGIEDADEQADADWLAAKITQPRIFDDAAGVMNESLKDRGGELMLVSQFTLHASTRKGNRPSYLKASKPPHAVPLYEYLVSRLEHELGRPVATGVFGADMQVGLVNDGPVTIWIDSKNRE